MPDEHKPKLVSEELPSTVADQIALFDALAQGLKDSLASLDHNMSRRFDSFESQVDDKLDGLRESVEKKLEGAHCTRTDKFSEIDHRLEANEEGLGSLEKSSSTAKVHFAWKVVGWVVGLIVVLASAAFFYGYVNRQVEDNTTRVRTLEGAFRSSLNTTTERYVSNKGLLSALGKDVEKLEGRTTKHDDLLTKLSLSLVQLKSERMPRVRRRQSRSSVEGR